MSTSLVWFRHDLRLADNPAWHTACTASKTVIPLFIWAPEEEGDWLPGGASQWWFHQSLHALGAALRAQGSRLLLRRGPSLETLLALARETGASAIYWSRRYEPAIIARDKTIKETLRAAGLQAESCNAALLREPWTIQNKSGKPFQVFTPFWKHCLTLPDPPEPLPAPKIPGSPSRFPTSLQLAELGLEPKIPWADGLRAAWQPGEFGALQQLNRFLATSFENYSAARNLPASPGTSRLSPFLHFGEISPRQIWHALRRHAEKRGLPIAAWRASQYLAEVGWREFAHHLLYHFPRTPAEPLRPEFAKFPWRDNPVGLRAWQRGRTGFPIVDAGLRELWATGWMHNRVRMITASFLVKDLLISWREGAAWFWDTLVDADLAQNTLGWQWTAGCGADAAPYFRVFNPASQGEKFDPDGAYVRHWCPELARLPADWIHRPHEAPPEILARAGLRLGLDYPEPLLSHAIAREVALEAYTRLRNSSA